jgi:hypothetical protein
VVRPSSGTHYSRKLEGESGSKLAWLDKLRDDGQLHHLLLLIIRGRHETNTPSP